MLLLWLLSHQHPPKEPCKPMFLISASAIAFICIGGLFLYLGRDCVSLIPKLRSIEVSHKNFSEFKIWIIMDLCLGWLHNCEENGPK
ncbi:hypothetical protein GQ457_11G016820 [Hibiscus cannabinus]